MLLVPICQWYADVYPAAHKIRLEGSRYRAAPGIILGPINTLHSFGRKVYEASHRKELMNPDQRTYMALNHDQQSVFWTNYAIQRQKLESQVRLSDIARRIIDRINSIPDSDLPYGGKKLYEMQNGKIPMKQKPTDEEWTRIWEAYRGRKR